MGDEATGWAMGRVCPFTKLGVRRESLACFRMSPAVCVGGGESGVVVCGGGWGMEREGSSWWSRSSGKNRVGEGSWVASVA